MFKTFLAAALLAGGALGYTPEALADQVTNLPGAEKLDIPFNQFSGYLTVNATKQMHYWMVESMGDPATDPIAFWTNGGPGCSGLLGFMGEQGPFRPNEDLSLSFNEYAWNKVANMVFVEQPCGVGFSTSTAEDTSYDYSNNDEQAAKDNYAMIQAFMQRFPEYAKNDLYYTSESYGGHYMPTLAKEIVDRNAAGNDPVLNYKGFAVGNPATTFQSTTPAMLEMYWGHQVVAKPTWDKYTAECIDYKVLPNVSMCEMLFMDMYVQIGGLNPYAIDYPVCTADSPRGSVAKHGRAQRHWMLNNIFHGASDELKKTVGLEPVEGYEPCEEDYMTAWVNQESVKEALHVKSSIEWEQCSRSIRYKQSDGHNSMVPYYQYLIDGNFGLNILVYSGDDDSVCATVGTQGWIWDMGYKVAGRMWQSYVLDGQTAGYFTAWKDTKLGFLTVHGAGHEVPTYKPAVALDLFTKYLKGEWTSA
jgi:carboxypeptidase C (cathepsin A)